MEGFDASFILEIINEIIALIKKIIGLIPKGNIEDPSEVSQEAEA